MANRQLAILRILSGGKIFSMAELAEKTESSISTIQRDLLDLSVYSIESVMGQGGGVRLSKKSILVSILTKNELAYILDAVINSEGDRELRRIILEKLNGTK